jgi:hypothetical protein
MKSFDIVTLTVSPALDKSAHFSGLVPEQKIRCQTPLFDAGGGGINVSKRYPDSRENHLHNNFWRIDRRNAKKALKNQFLLKPLKHEVGHGKISLQLMTTRILSLFSVTTVTIAEKIKSFQLFKN